MEGALEEEDGLERERRRCCRKLREEESGKWELNCMLSFFWLLWEVLSNSKGSPLLVDPKITSATNVGSRLVTN